MASSQAYAKHPQHKVEIDPGPASVRVTWQGRELARSDRARVLRESRCAPVAYLPREDVDLSLLERSDHTTYCQFKGHASYYTLRAGDAREENAVWSYEDPYDQMAGIRGHLAFHPDRVAIEGVA